MRIIVTGATGFLGTHLCPALERQGHEVTRLGSRECDLTQAGALERVAAGLYDRIYHLAAWTQAGEFCLHHAGEQWIINQQLNTNVLAWWQRSQPQAKQVCMGTSCAYDPALALSEENYLTGKPIDSLFTYAMTKRMLYTGLLALHRQFGLRYLHLAPSTLFGPGYHTDGRQMHFIFDLIRKIIRGKEYGEPVILWGDGHQRRELVYIDDCVDIMLRLAETCDNELVNIGMGEDYSIREFAQLVCDEVGYDSGRLVYDTSRYVGARSKMLEVAKLHHLLPGLELTPLHEGLARTIEWFRQNPHAYGAAAG